MLGLNFIVQRQACMTSAEKPGPSDRGDAWDECQECTKELI